MSDTQLQIGTAGRFGLLKQSAFDTPQTNDANFHYFPFTACDFALQQAQGALPMESGGEALPRGVYKAGAFMAGGVTMIPRLDNRFGWILEATCGDSSFYDDQTIAQVIAGSGSEAGVDTHLFGFLDTDEFDIPYLTTHRLLPNSTAAQQVGEVGEDVRITSLGLNIVAQQIVTARVDMLGRATATTLLDLNPGWSTPTYDNVDAFAVAACTGSVSLSITSGTPASSTAFDVRTASLVWGNNLLPPQASARVGYAHPKDFPITGRTIGVTATVYVDDYDLYMQTIGGPLNPVADTGWLCSPLDGDIDVTISSGAQIGATGEYYSLRYLTDQGNIKWLARPIVLVPNQPVLLQMTGSIATVSAGRPFYIYLQNDRNAEYS